MIEILNTYWAEILLAILTALGTITALSETKADDRIVNILKRVLEAIVLGRSRGKRK
jgi:hypothetical protein